MDTPLSRSAVNTRVPANATRCTDPGVLTLATNVGLKPENTLKTATPAFPLATTTRLLSAATSTAGSGKGAFASEPVATARPLSGSEPCWSSAPSDIPSKSVSNIISEVPITCSPKSGIPSLSESTFNVVPVIGSNTYGGNLTISPIEGGLTVPTIANCCVLG